MRQTRRLTHEALMTRSLSILMVLLFTVYAQLIVKARALAMDSIDGGHDRVRYLIRMFTDPGVISAQAAVLVAGVFWLLTIKRTDLAYAYPFMALSFLLVPLGSNVLFGERLPSLQIVGLVLIVVGVAISAWAR
jgi:drug/metabolite transporter (DMT)-like permease